MGENLLTNILFHPPLSLGIPNLHSNKFHLFQQGDSGGPLNYDIGDGTYCTEGITSFVSSAGCESGLPDGFTRLTHYLEWIEATTGIVIPE